MTPRLPKLDINRFGAGYWLGALASTLIYIPSALPHPEDGAWFGFFGVLIAVAGVNRSVTTLILGVQQKDISRVVGGIVGCSLSVWPLAWLVHYLVSPPF